MNERGTLAYRIVEGTNVVDYLWSSGTARDFSELLVSTNYSAVSPSFAMNDRGWIICLGERADNGTTDWFLQFTDSLSPPRWRMTDQNPKVQNDQAVLINLVIGPSRFYRLRQF